MKFVLAGVVLAVAEIYVLIKVAGALGIGWTLLLLVALSALGPRLIRRSGAGAWRRLRQRLDQGGMPGREVVDGLLVLVAGVCVTIPGFITDAVGLLLLLPPVRSLVRRLLMRRFTPVVGAVSGLRQARGRWRGPIVDAESTEDPPEPPRRAIGRGPTSST